MLKLNKIISAVRGRIIMSKTNNKKTSTKEDKQPLSVHKALGGFGGVFMAFVVASVAYSTYVVYAGTTGLAPKLMLIPQALFAGIIVLYKFAK